MNLFSLMQSICELEDENKGHEQVKKTFLFVFLRVKLCIFKNSPIWTLCNSTILLISPFQSCLAVQGDLQDSGYVAKGDGVWLTKEPAWTFHQNQDKAGPKAIKVETDTRGGGIIKSHPGE